MAKKLGGIVSIDRSLYLFGKYMKMKVEMGIMKPLKRGLTVGVGGVQLWLPLKYEGLPLFCNNCGMIGHTFKACEGLHHMEEQNPHELPFVLDIKASPMKKNRSWPAKNEAKRYPPSALLLDPFSKSVSSSTGSHVNLSSSNHNQLSPTNKANHPPPLLAKDPTTCLSHVSTPTPKPQTLLP